jgi:hypothetical protein
MSADANGKHDRDHLIVAALASGSTYGDAARKSGVSKATVARRMGDWEFRVRVADERERVVERVRGQLLAQAPGAVDVLAELSANATNESARIRAATQILDYALRRRAGLDAFESTEVRSLVREVVEIALVHVPVEAQETFLRKVCVMGKRVG